MSGPDYGMNLRKRMNLRLEVVSRIFRSSRSRCPLVGAEAFCGHGILLNCIAGDDAYRLLREHVLASRHVRVRRPHITLAHPRNPQAPGNSLINAARLPHVIEVTFSTVCLIEQIGCAPWKLLERFSLPG